MESKYLHDLHGFMSFTATLCAVVLCLLINNGLPNDIVEVVGFILFGGFIHFLLVGFFDLFHEFANMFIGENYILKQIGLGIILYLVLYFIFLEIGIM